MFNGLATTGDAGIQWKEEDHILEEEELKEEGGEREVLNIAKCHDFCWEIENGQNDLATWLVLKN